MAGFEHCYDAATGIFTFGSLPVLKEKSTVSKPDFSGKWYFAEFSDRMQLRTGSDDFLVMAGKGISHKNLGKTIHSILSEISTTTDLEPACKKALASGLVQPEEMDTVLHQLQQMIGHPVGGDWFSGNYRVLTETDLLTPGLTLRPDRMMISGDRVIVVDYKSGELRTDAHRRQVGQYAQTLVDAGYTNVAGYLWYIRENELVEVALP